MSFQPPQPPVNPGPSASSLKPPAWTLSLQPQTRPPAALTLLLPALHLRKHRKRPNLTVKCRKSSSRLLLELSGPPSGALGFPSAPGTSHDAARPLLEPRGDAPEAQKTTRLDRKMPQSESRHPGLSQGSQATVLELWASPDLLGPSGTQLGTSWSHLETTPKQRKRPNLTGKYLNLEVIVEACSKALGLPFWSSGLSLTS